LGRVKQVCPHGLLGKTDCKICQREAHTLRVRELRRQQKELLDEENTLEKEYAREHTKVFMEPMKGAEEVSKEPSITVDKFCGNCVKREGCKSSLFYRTYRGAGECKSWKAWPKKEATA